MARPQKDLLMRIIRGHLSGLGEMVGRCVVSRISDQTAWKWPVESTNCKKNQELEDLAKLEFRLVRGRSYDREDWTECDVQVMRKQADRIKKEGTRQETLFRV